MRQTHKKKTFYGVMNSLRDISKNQHYSDTEFMNSVLYLYRETFPVPDRREEDEKELICVF